jgi:hypothetical protein
VFEASVLLVERGKPETVERLRTRGSQGPDDSLGHGEHMEQERGAFKVDLKSNPLMRKANPAARWANEKISLRECRKVMP